jgi:hypothetical protein
VSASLEDVAGGPRRDGLHEQEHEERSDTQREGGRGWSDLVGWIEEQGEEDTQGFWGREWP